MVVIVKLGYSEVLNMEWKHLNFCACCDTFFIFDSDQKNKRILAEEDCTTDLTVRTRKRKADVATVSGKCKGMRLVFTNSGRAISKNDVNVSYFH